ncbi:MAG TPA: DUF3303 family protein [Solirubrobacterales bacterium]|nr:DUF3303 family protein [Solirubrobacterales bacterium]
MKFATIYRPKYPAPPELIPDLLKEMGAWMQRYADRLENVQFFIGGGGFGTVDSDDAALLAKMITEHPFTIYSDVEIKPLVDPATALGILQETYS